MSGFYAVVLCVGVCVPAPSQMSQGTGLKFVVGAETSWCVVVVGGYRQRG